MCQGIKNWARLIQRIYEVDPLICPRYHGPLRCFLVIIRDIFLKGTGVTILWPHMAALLAIGVALMTLAVRRVSKTLD